MAWRLMFFATRVPGQEETRTHSIKDLVFLESINYNFIHQVQNISNIRYNILPLQIISCFFGIF